MVRGDLALDVSVGWVTELGCSEESRNPSELVPLVCRPVLDDRLALRLQSDVFLGLAPFQEGCRSSFSAVQNVGFSVVPNADPRVLGNWGEGFLVIRHGACSVARKSFPNHLWHCALGGSMRANQGIAYFWLLPARKLWFAKSPPL